MKPTVLVMSCEHATGLIPHHYLNQFQGANLESNRLYDVGALDITRLIANKLDCPFTQSSVSHLLIDCNRSLSHAHCFSKHTAHLSKQEKKILIDTYYLPFQQQTQDMVLEAVQKQQQVLHLSIQSFTPILQGLIQNAGIGILYAANRHGEKEVARLLHGLLLQETPDYRIRMNYPFSARSNYGQKALRKLYQQSDYLGIKLEINQALLTEDDAIQAMAKSISKSLKELLDLL